MAPCEHMLSNNNYGHQLINVLSDKFLCSTSSSSTALNKLCVTAEVCFPPTTYIYNNNNQSVTKSHLSAFSSPFAIHHHHHQHQSPHHHLFTISLPVMHVLCTNHPPSPASCFRWFRYTFYDECIKLLFTAYLLYK